MPQRPMARINTCPCLLPYVWSAPQRLILTIAALHFSTKLPNKCLISNTIQMRRPLFRMRARSAPSGVHESRPAPRPTHHSLITTHCPS